MSECKHRYVKKERECSLPQMLNDILDFERVSVSASIEKKEAGVFALALTPALF